MNMRARYINEEKTHLAFNCLGCGQEHHVPVGADGWQFNNDLEKPTLKPSILVRSGHYLPDNKPGDPCWCNTEDAPFGCSVCHSFVTNGTIQYLDDCTHQYKGQTIELPEVVLQ